ncbi:MAG TPA: polysaccharide biosynthesis protein, partial [Dysgonomonas sp.]|nr:polysaccharide biosynthesis protein [Dysgonomonas sp.]
MVFAIFYIFIGPSGSVAMVYTCVLFMLSLMGILGFRIFVVYTYQSLTLKYRSEPLIPVYLWGINHDNITFAQILNANNSKYRVKGLVDERVDRKVKGNTNLHTLNISDSKSLVYLKKNGVLFADDNIIRDKKEL